MLILAFFAFPLALYCLVLGLLNRRAHPVLVHGSWDCLGLLLGLSGALCLAVPALFAALYDREVWALLLTGPSEAQVSFAELLEGWWRIWLAYGLAVLAGAGFLLWWRARVTVLYNMDAPRFDSLLAQLLDRCGLEWTRLGNRVFIRFRDPGAPKTMPASEAKTGADQEAVLDVEPFYAARNVTLIWQKGPGRLRPDIEAELARELQTVAGPRNPAAGWLLGIAAVLFTLVVVGLGLVLLVQIMRG